MKKETLHEAILEGRRFLKAAEELEHQAKRLEAVDYDIKRYKHFDLSLAKYTAAVKRASMDLSRTLSALRQSK